MASHNSRNPFPRFSRPLHLKMRPGAQAAGEARHAVDGLDGVLDPSQLQTVRLLVTELVTNAVRHAGCHEWIGLDIALTGDSVHVEVRDCGPGFDRPVTPEPHGHRLGGYGLCLVDRLADCWGVAPEDLNCVWFEVPRSASPEYATA